MKKLSLFIFLPLVCLTSTFAQISFPEISTGIQYSNIRTSIVPWKRGSVWRRGFWVTASSNYKIKKWVKIEAGITYQERIPLEVLPFSKGDEAAQITGLNSQVLFSEYPTSPQHKFFYTANYLRIPNFKYLNIEVVPMITYGKVWSFSVGAGLFGGILMNRNQTTITKEDLPHVASFFDSPGDAYGEVVYYKYDVGWIPKIKVQYKISPKVKVGLHLKSYQSLVRLNDTFVYSDLNFNMRWMAFAGGLSFEYHFYKPQK